MKVITATLVVAAAILFSNVGHAAGVAPDEASAMALLKESKCLSCHSVDKKKDGPSYKSIAEKYRDNPDADAKLTKWITEKHPVEIDGEEEEHGVVKTRDAAKIANLVKFLRSR